MNPKLISVGDTVMFEETHENPNGTKMMLVGRGRVEVINRNFTPSLCEITVEDDSYNNRFVSICHLKKVS